MKNKLLIFFSLIIFCTLQAQSKPFRRVLVMSGGGVNPGTYLGMVHGLKERGWTPDLIITTCGASFASVIHSAGGSIDEDLKILYSEPIYKGFNTIQVPSPWVWDLKSIFDRTNHRTQIPQIFSNIVLSVPQMFSNQLKNLSFDSNQTGPRIIMVGSKSLFKPQHVGAPRQIIDQLFQQVYFTDTVTAQVLKNYKIKLHHAYPYTNVTNDFSVETDFTPLEAYRASIADPFLLEPYFKNNEFYFTGAIDLYPLDLALELGDEVIATYPQQLYSKYEIAAIESTFGFSQTIRALEAIQKENISWIDVNGIDSLSFNPSLHGIKMVSNVPKDKKDFFWKLYLQWQFGKERAKETLSVPPHSRLHLRSPINKNLLYDFTCQSANAWKTPDSKYCTQDSSPGCHREKVKYCIPIR